MARVLVVDDDPSLLKALRLGLTARGHEVLTATDGAQGVASALSASPDVVILDLGLPDIDGLTACRRIRQSSDVPILVLSATHTEERKVSALDGGADDYVTKPFGMAELEARVRAAIRHRSPEPAETSVRPIAVGPLEVDFVHHEAWRDGTRLELTAKEFEFLSVLVRHAGRTCTRQMILQAVWGEGYVSEAQYLHVYVHRLRQKLDDSAGTLIRTIPGIGYALAAEPAAS